MYAVTDTMATTEIRSSATRIASSWRELERMKTYQVPIALGGAIGVLAGVVTYGLAVIQRAAFVPSATAVFLGVFGIMALIGYMVSKAHMRNGAIVAGVAGLGLLLLASGVAGLLTGLLVIAGAAWGFIRSF